MVRGKSITDMDTFFCYRENDNTYSVRTGVELKTSVTFTEALIAGARAKNTVTNDQSIATIKNTTTIQYQVSQKFYSLEATEEFTFTDACAARQIDPLLPGLQ